MGVLDEAILGRPLGAPSPRPQTIDCDSSIACTSDGSDCTEYTYCIEAINIAADGTYDVVMSCTREDVSGFGVGDGDGTLTATLDGVEILNRTTRDCGFGFDGDFSFTATGGEALEVVFDWPFFGGHTFIMNATVPVPLDIVDGTGTITPNPVDEDEAVEFAADFANNNADTAFFDILVVDGAGTIWSNTDAALLAGETATITLPQVIPQDIGIGPGDYTLEMQVVNQSFQSGSVVEGVAARKQFDVSVAAT